MLSASGGIAMSHRVPLPLAVRRSLFVLLTVACGLLATGTVRAEPYRHTVLIDGVLDFTGGEILATSTWASRARTSAPRSAARRPTS
jgi:hypothetical protein